MQRFQRYDDEGWFRVGPVEVTTSILVAGLAAIFLVLGVAAPEVFREPLWYDAATVRSGEVWRLFTWPLVNPVDIWPILSIVMMAFVGGEIERELRRRRFAWLVGTLVVVPALVGLAFEVTATAGMSRLVSPLFVVFVLWRPTLQWFFGIPLWVIVVVFQAIDLLQILDLRNSGFPIGGLLAFWAASLVVAALMTRAFDITEFHQIPKIPLPAFVTGDPYAKANRAREKAQRSRSRGSHRSAPRKPGGRRAPAEVVPIRPEARLDRASQADMDELLDKISATGMDSLSPAERARLDELSRRLRGE